MKIKDTEVLSVVEGEWNKVRAGEFTNFAIDSRKVLPGGLFFALKGERTDGHLYVRDALRNGAKGVILEREIGEFPGVFVLKAISSKQALLSLGKHARSLLTGKVIGVTGSAGKTTTKEMIALALKTEFSVSSTKGNANTEYSIPLFFLNDAKKESDFHIIETGVQKPGDMKVLTDIALPDAAVLLNAGESHLEFLKTVKLVAAEKFELAKFVSERNGISVINGDDPEFSLLAKSLKAGYVSFGFSRSNNVYARIIFMSPDEMSLKVFSFDESAVQRFPFSGIHYAYDILATVAVSGVFGIELKDILSAVSLFTPIPGRGKERVLKGGRVLIDETYNANPLSLKYSLSRFKNRKRKLFVIVGDMLELGEEAEKIHSDAGKVIASFTPEYLITFGEYSRRISETCALSGVRNIRHFNDRDSLLKYISETEIPEDTFIFVKGSRGMRMEDIMEILIKRFGNDG